MKSKNILFSILEEMTKKKIEQEMLNIKHLYLKKKDDKQLALLLGYQKEYKKRLYDKKMSGIYVHEWNNYSIFISVLQKIIQDNKNIIENHQKLIEKKLSIWSRNQVELKIWQHLSIKNKTHILRIKKIQEQIDIDRCIQLKILKKGLLF